MHIITKWGWCFLHVMWSFRKRAQAKVITIFYFVLRVVVVARNPSKLMVRLVLLFRPIFGFVKPLAAKLFPKLLESIYKSFSNYQSSPRYYIKGDLTPQKFFAHLNAAGEKYVLLRWWENIDDWDVDEDFDILVLDINVEIWRSLVQVRPNKYKIDLYSDNGNLDGFIHTPHYSNEISRRIFSNRVKYQDILYRPCDEDFHLSILYHMLLHKGVLSGLLFDGYAAIEMEKKYRDVLQQWQTSSFDRQKIVTAEDAVNILKENNFYPPDDLFEKYKEKRKELKTLQPVTEATGFENFFLIFVREMYGTQDMLEAAISVLSENGYVVLFCEQIDEAMKQKVANDVRGGNWSSGGFEISSGTPSHWIVAIDKLEDGTASIYQNRRIKTKDKIRRLLHCQNGFAKIGNPVHSTDNGAETLQYLPLLCSEVQLQLLNSMALAMQETHKHFKVSRYSVTWYNKEEDVFKRLYGCNKRQFLEKEQKFSALFAEHGYGIISRCDSLNVLSSEMGAGIDKVTPDLVPKLEGFYNFLRTQKIMLPDLRLEQFVIADNGALAYVDYKYLIIASDLNEWQNWFDTGMVSPFRHHDKELPLGYGTYHFSPKLLK